jgi:hypothetical protein
MIRVRKNKNWKRSVLTTVFKKYKMKTIFVLIFLIFSNSLSEQTDQFGSNVVCNIVGECQGRILVTIEDVLDQGKQMAQCNIFTTVIS